MIKRKKKLTLSYPQFSVNLTTLIQAIAHVEQPPEHIDSNDINLLMLHFQY